MCGRGARAVFTLCIDDDAHVAALDVLLRHGQERRVEPELGA